MRINGKQHRTIAVNANGRTVRTIDQRLLPHELVMAELRSCEDAAVAIETMLVRGAPLIGGAAAYGMALAMHEDASDEGIERAYARLVRTRPTAINLRWALDRMCHALRNRPRERRVELAYAEAARICDEDVAICEAIGEHGLGLIR